MPEKKKKKWIRIDRNTAKKLPARPSRRLQNIMKNPGKLDAAKRIPKDPGKAVRKEAEADRKKGLLPKRKATPPGKENRSGGEAAKKELKGKLGARSTLSDKLKKREFMPRPAARPKTPAKKPIEGMKGPEPAKKPKGMPSRTKVAKEGSSRTVTIKRGDNLTKLARRYGTTVDAIVKANTRNKKGVRNRNLIIAGRKLVIPPSRTPRPRPKKKGE